MLPFDVVLFDVGGVLLTNGWDVKERAEVAAQFHLDIAELESRHVRHAEIVDRWERGGATIDDYLDAVVFYQPRTFSRDEFVASMQSQSKLLQDGAMAVLQEVAATGTYLVGALNNEVRELNEYRFQTFGLRNYFEVALTSCYVGQRKPEPAMYRCAIDILGRPPGRILFIDDRKENVIGAETAGIVAIRFEGEAELREQLARFSEMSSSAKR